METCFDLYLDVPHGWPGCLRSLRDEVVLLRRIAVTGNLMAVAAEQCDIPEHVRDKTDYRLVITCPVLGIEGGSEMRSMLSLLLLLEMEF